MSVYTTLLLGTGGGIIPETRKRYMNSNTAAIFIGLGGTGMDCLRAIKNAVHSNIHPDSEDTPISTYSHIGFLGIDRDCTPENFYDAEIEFVDISIRNFSDVHPSVIKTQEEFNWLNWEEMDTPMFERPSDRTYWRTRQGGRYRLIKNANIIIERIEKIIEKITQHTRCYTIQIHIFSGTCGTTGSGGILDLSYLIRSIQNKDSRIIVNSYLFMPDAVISKLSYRDPKLKNHLFREGYALLKEWDYCMQIPQNGGSFSQRYTDDIVIEWNKAPVDICHLVCATDSQGSVIENAYDYTISVTVEHVIDYLIDFNSKYTRVLQGIRTANEFKKFGAGVNYCAIGASAIHVPIKEIYTYLVATLFDKFSYIAQNVPSKMDVERLAMHSFGGKTQNMNRIYDSLYGEIRKGINGVYCQYTNDWKYVRDFGNAELVAHYSIQTENQLNCIYTNCEKLVTSENQASLIGNVKNYLDTVICCDINYGPIYAYRMISTYEQYNLLNIIDELTEYNLFKKDQASNLLEVRKRDYDIARENFEFRRKRHFLDNDKQRFDDYEYYLSIFEQNKLELAICERIDYILHIFRKQIIELARTYRIWARIMDTLIQTFKENSIIITNENIMQKFNSFSTPIMTISELKESLNAKIDQINVPEMFDSFMLLFINNPYEWIDEDECRISELVTDFFVKTVFGGFANRSITSFIKDKYGLTNDALLADRIYQDWINLLVTKSTPLFDFGKTIARQSHSSEILVLTTPTSAPIQAATKRLTQENIPWEIKTNGINTRVCALQMYIGFPLASYRLMEELCCIAESTLNMGRYLYQGKPIDGLCVQDWSLLPPPIPQSLLCFDRMPITIRAIVSEAKSLFDVAKDIGVIDDNNNIYRISEESVLKIREKANACIFLAKQISSSDVNKAEIAIKELEDSLRIRLINTGYSLERRGYADSEGERESIYKDYFVAAPAYQVYVKKLINEIEEIKECADLAKRNLQDAMFYIISPTSIDFSTYCNSIFAGVISIEGRNVIYHQTNDGIITDYVLSKRGGEYTYSSIPVYQGFLSYKILDTNIKNEIKNIANERLATDSPELISKAEQLKEVFADDRINAWAQLAAEYPNRMAILDFLSKLKKNFNIFYSENIIDI